MPKVIMFRTDFEELVAGNEVEKILVFRNLSEAPAYTRDSPNAFFVEVELSLTREDIKKAFLKQAG